MFSARCRRWVFAAAVACVACGAGCERKTQPVEPPSTGGHTSPDPETPPAEAKKKPEQAFLADNWEEALAATRADGSKNAAVRLASWLAEQKDIVRLASLLGTDGRPADEFSRHVFEAYSERLEGELASRKPRDEGGSVQESFETLASTDPWIATGVAFALGDPKPDAAAVLQARAGWHAGKADRERALSLIITASTSNKDAALSFGQGVLEEWMVTDTLSASEWIEQVAPLQPSLSELSAMVASRLAAKSPATAIQWLGRLPAAYGEVAAGPLAAGWAQVDPIAALAWGEEYSEKKNRAGVLEDAVVSAAQVRPEIVLGWLGGNTRLGTDDRAELVRTASGVWAQRDPRGSFRWLSENRNKEVSLPAVEGSARALARRDPRLATEIALLAVDGRQGVETLLATLETWRKYRVVDFTSGVESLASRLREEGNTWRADILLSTAARAGQD